jgi:hypothetical protein
MESDHDRGVTRGAPPCCEHAEENARLRRELADARRQVEELRPQELGHTALVFHPFGFQLHHPLRLGS